MSEVLNLEKAKKSIAGKLVGRELQIFVGILDGKTVQQIAEAINVKKDSCYVYVSHVYKKLKADGRQGLFDWARDRELLQEGEPNDLSLLFSTRRYPSPALKAPSTFDRILKPEPAPNPDGVIEDDVGGPAEDVDDPEGPEPEEGTVGVTIEPPVAPKLRAAPAVTAHMPSFTDKKPPPAKVAEEGDFLTLQDLQGKRVSLIVRNIGDHPQRIGATATKTLSFEVLNLGDRDLAFVVERERGRIVSLQNAATIAEIHFMREGAEQ